MQSRTGIVALTMPFLASIFSASLVQQPRDHVRSAATPKWEVVSVKPCAPANPLPGERGQGGAGGGPPLRFSPDRMTMNCQTVRKLLESAYLTNENAADTARQPGSRLIATQVGASRVRTTPIERGPAWIDSERYTIEAKAEGTPDPLVMQGPMLQVILEDRFKLKVHWETREIPIQALTVAKGGLKLKSFQEGSCTVPPPPDSTTNVEDLRAKLPPGGRYCNFYGGLIGPNAVNVKIDAEGITIDEFARIWLSSLGTPQDRVVVDKTGVTGRFNFQFEYLFGNARRQRIAEETGRTASEVSSAPLLPEALQEYLGLKLEPSKGPGEFLVIDQIEHPLPN